MYFARKTYNIPLEWQHDPCLLSADGRTVAMIMSGAGNVDIPVNWRH